MLFFKRSKKNLPQRVVVKEKEQKFTAPPGRRNKTLKKIATNESGGRPIFLRWVFYILLIAFIAVTVYVLFVSSFILIQNISVSGTEDLSADEILGKTKDLVDGKYFNVVPKSNFLLLSEKRISQYLLGEFKKIKTARVEKIFPSDMMIELEERESLVVWCVPANCYIVDDEGYAYAEVSLDSKEVRENNLAKLVSQEDKQISVGEKIMNQQYVDFASKIHRQLEEINLEVREDIVVGSLVAGDLEVTTEDGWKIMLSVDSPLSRSASTLRTFLEKEIDDDMKGELEYVDLRIENRVYYKLKEKESEDENESKKSEEGTSDDEKKD